MLFRLTLVVMILTAVSTHARAACKQDCRPAKRECTTAASARGRALIAACAGEAPTNRRACKKTARATAKQLRAACGRFGRDCKSCCAGDGQHCTARCGDGEVTATTGEECDPPGAACSGGATCDAACHCPPVTTTSTTGPTATTGPTPTTQPTTTTTSSTSPTTTTTSPELGDCLAATKAGNLASAAPSCAAAAAQSPHDPGVVLLASVEALADDVLGAPASADLAGQAGIGVTGSASAVCDLRVTLPGTFPVSTPAGSAVIGLAHGAGLAAIDHALTILALYSSGSSSLDPANLPVCLAPPTSSPIDVDAGDVLAARSLLEGLAALVHVAAAYDSDVPLAGVLNGTTSAQQVFTGAPTLLTLLAGGAPELGQARAKMGAALDDLQLAIDAIEAEGDDQSNDFLVIDPADHADVVRIRAAASLFKTALDGEATFPAASFTALTVDQRLTLDAFFDGTLASLRPLVPGFDGFGNPDLCALPDPTAAGAAPDMTAAILRQLLGLTCP